MNRRMTALVATLAIALLTGCATRQPKTEPEQTPVVAPALPVANGIVGQIVTLPNGTTLSTTSADLPDLASVHPEILGLGPGGDPVAQAAGNHVEEIRQEEVSLPIGRAYLAVVVRGQPSAANSTEQSNELWLIAVRKHPQRSDMRLAYAIIGQITGDEAKAKEQLLELGRQWQLPAE